MKKVIASALFILLAAACKDNNVQTKGDVIIANGQMPVMVKDSNNRLHVAFGNGDSIMYTFSKDNGNTFSTPGLITEIPHVYTYATRGPQIAATDKNIILTACTTEGNIYSFYKENHSNWRQGNRVNDADTVCKEGLMALSADGNMAFAVWLDLRGNQRNKIYGAKSVDGGITWSKNMLIYASPDSSVCECCRPSVIVWKNKVAVMFRNWLNGNRDMYLAQSNNGGNSFSAPQKLGNGSWKLNGCPMDGGNFVINNKGEVQTVWRRQAIVYFDTPGMPEEEIGKGIGGTVETANNKNVFAWVENGNVIVTRSGRQKKIIGEGSQPVLKAINDNHFICLWQNNKQIHAAIIQL